MQAFGQGRPAGCRPALPAPCPAPVVGVPGRGPVAAPAASSIGPSHSQQAPLTSFVSAHPDAVRRRAEAERRRVAVRADVDTVLKSNWFEAELGPNVCAVSTPEAFRAATAVGRLVVADFFTPGCAACRRMFPKLKQIMAAHPGVDFLLVNCGDSGNAALLRFVQSLGVDRLPYFTFHKGGAMITKFPANLTKVDQLRAEISYHK